MFVRSSVSSFLSSLILRPTPSISRHILSCFWLLPTLTTVLLPDVSLQTSSFQFFHVLFAVCSPFVDCGDSGIETRKEKWNRMKRKKKVNCLKCFDRTLNYQSLLFPKSKKKKKKKERKIHSVNERDAKLTEILSSVCRSSCSEFNLLLLTDRFCVSQDYFNASRKGIERIYGFRLLQNAVTARKCILFVNP